MKSKKIYILFLGIIALLLCSCGKNAQNREAVVDADLQNQMWDLFSTATSIGVYENEDDTYKVVVTCTGVESVETIETAKNICLANNTTIIYAYFHSDFGHITYSYENGIEKYKMTTDDKIHHVLDYDQFVICLNNGCPDFDSNGEIGYKVEDNHDESTEDSHNTSQESLEGNTTSEVSGNEDLNGAVLRVYEAVCNYMNNSGELQVDFNDLRIMYEYWEVVETMGLYERPLDMEEYVAMRSGQTVSFHYDEGVRLIWGVDANTIDIVCSEE